MPKILVNFIKDHAGFTAVYFLSSALVIAFFNIIAADDGEIVYPFLISLFIYMVFIISRLPGYIRFHTELRKTVESPACLLRPSTAGEAHAAETIASIHEKYMGELTRIRSEQKARDQFITQWVHNMKTPVSVIDLILQKMAADGITGAGLPDIREENGRLLSGLEQMLHMMRLTDFSRDCIPEPVDLSEAVRSVINEKRNQFIYSNVFPKLHHDGSPVIVLTDAKWNRVMLEQVVSNAIKYSGGFEESRNVHFDFRAENGRVILSIRDEGVGIPEYDLPRVFEPFFTGENGRKFRNSSGIGLFICKTIADKLGHHISIKSEAGKGATVSISYISKM
ncbi:MAG: sensor histidine kinase [Bacillota bacterium]